MLIFKEDFKNPSCLYENYFLFRLILFELFSMVCFFCIQSVVCSNNSILSHLFYQDLFFELTILFCWNFPFMVPHFWLVHYLIQKICCMPTAFAYSIWLFKVSLSFSQRDYQNCLFNLMLKGLIIFLLCLLILKLMFLPLSFTYFCQKSLMILSMSLIGFAHAALNKMVSSWCMN